MPSLASKLFKSLRGHLANAEVKAKRQRATRKAGGAKATEFIDLLDRADKRRTAAKPKEPTQ